MWMEVGIWKCVMVGELSMRKWMSVDGAWYEEMDACVDGGWHVEMDD